MKRKACTLLASNFGNLIFEIKGASLLPRAAMVTFKFVRRTENEMRKFNLASTLVIVLTLSAATLALSFELATTIEKNGNTFSVSGTGYTRMNLIKIKTKEKGTIILKGRVAVHQGMANIVMWSKVNGKFYFSKLPGLLNFSAATPTSFSIPFSSPKDIITEVVLEIELPQGGQIKIDSLALSKS